MEIKLMTRVDIEFVDTLGFQIELNEKFGEGHFTVCVDRTHELKSKYIEYDETITQSVAVTEELSLCGAHSPQIVTIRYILPVTQQMINEVISMANVHHENILNEQKQILLDYLDLKCDEIIKEKKPNILFFDDYYAEAIVWNNDRSLPCPLNIQIYAKQNNISIDESVVSIITSKQKKDTFALAIKNLRLLGKLQLLECAKFTDLKLKSTAIIDNIINLQY
jgi:hypothetical protein